MSLEIEIKPQESAPPPQGGTGEVVQAAQAMLEAAKELAPTHSDEIRAMGEQIKSLSEQLFILVGVVSEIQDYVRSINAKTDDVLDELEEIEEPPAAAEAEENPAPAVIIEQATEGGQIIKEDAPIAVEVAEPRNEEKPRRRWL